MRIEFEVSRGEEYYRALQRGLVLPGVRRTVVLAVGLAVSGPLMIWVSAAEGVGTVVGLISVIAGASLLVRARRVWVRLMAVPEGWTSRRRYMITDDALESVTELTETRWKWKAVRTVDVMPVAFLFRQVGGTAFDVPRAPLTGEQEAELLAVLAARGLVRADAAAC